MMAKVKVAAVVIVLAMAVAGVVVAYGATGAGPATLPAKTTPENEPGRS